MLLIKMNIKLQMTSSQHEFDRKSFQFDISDVTVDNNFIRFNALTLSVTIKNVQVTQNPPLTGKI